MDFKLFWGQLDGLALLTTENIPEGDMYLCGNISPRVEHLVDYFNPPCFTGTVCCDGVSSDGPDGTVTVCMKLL